MRDTPADRIEIDTADGWALPLFRGRDRAPGARPVLLVPGYGMNSTIFRYHVSGESFFERLAAAGLDPWALDLRGASTTRALRRSAGAVTLANQAFIDLPAAVDRIRVVTGAGAIGAVGCSLGGSLLYALVGASDRPGIDRLVTMGSPLRWTRTSLVRAFLATSPLSGALPVFGSRWMARAALPLAARFAAPALRIYLNPSITTIYPLEAIIRTVEDPLPGINREMARWMANGDLWLDGVSVTGSLNRYRGRLLVVHASGDGICDRASALSAVAHARGPVEQLEVTHPSGTAIGHADLFLCDVAPERAFTPIGRFLTSPNPDCSAGDSPPAGSRPGTDDTGS